MSWHCFLGSSVLGCLRSKHVPAKLESGACWNWNIITTKQDYLEQRFQMGLEMTLCYSEIISHSSSSGWEKCQAWHTFLGGMVLAFQAPGQHPHPPSPAGKYWALSCTGQVATWDKSQHPSKSPTLGSHVLGQVSQIKRSGKRISKTLQQ